jgi:hypothetical protein
MKLALLGSLILISCRPTVVLTREDVDPAKLEKKQMHRILRRSTVTLGPPPISCIRLRRTDSTREALACGRISSLESNGFSRPFPGAISWSGQQTYVITDANSYYVLPLTPGKHALQAGAIGFLISAPLPLTIEQGDSIIINYELLSDFRPLHR